MVYLVNTIYTILHLFLQPITINYNQSQPSIPTLDSSVHVKL